MISRRQIRQVANIVGGKDAFTKAEKIARLISKPEKRSKKPIASSIYDSYNFSRKPL